jgi:hypothetical protein
MKINNKQISVILISAFVLVLFYAFTVKAADMKVIGYMTTVSNIPPSIEEFQFLSNETHSEIIMLPDSDCTGIVNYCSYVYASGVNPSADINLDGKIDATDVLIVIHPKLYEKCTSGQACWSQPLDQCFFTLAGRKFKDPTRDCKMDTSDQTLVNNNYDKPPHPNINSPNCENDDICKSDLNQDGKVDIYDVVLVSSFYGKNADNFERLVQSGSKANVNKDGTSANIIDINDVVVVTSNYGKKAVELRCLSYNLRHLTGNQYDYTVSGIGLYYIGVAYIC